MFSAIPGGEQDGGGIERGDRSEANRTRSEAIGTDTEAKGSVTEASGAFSEACGPFSVLGETFSWVGHSVCCAGCRQRRARYLFPDDLGPVGRCDALPRTPEHGWQGAAERAFLALQFPARFVLCRLTRNSEKAPREHA